VPPIIPTVEPKVLVAGDTWQWYRARADFGQFPQSDGWSTRYDVTGPDVFSIAGSWQSALQADLFSLSAASTAAYVAGTVNWVLRMIGSGTYAGQLFSVASGTFLILPNYATQSAAITHNQKVLASIKAAIEGRTSGDFQNYSIAGRAITKIPILELMTLKSRYELLVWREANAGTNGPRVEVAFNAVAD
jgi:hypothetical protein